jgi:ABC-type phosphate transport system substrate-binding protein
MKTIRNTFYITALFLTHAFLTFSQTTDNNKVVITGVRFSYPLVEKWIKEYKAANPSSTVIIESRSAVDPAQYDLLIEAYEQDATVKESRDYLYIGRYALLPVANAKSAFGRFYSDKGLTNELIKQIYFSDIYANKKDAKKINAEFTIYTRLQKAGAPITFARYFNYEQVNIKGKAISGADEHLIKALLKDTTGLSYNVPGLLYNLETRKPIDGLTIIPVDADGNGKVSSDEKFYDNLDVVVGKIEGGELKNIPVEYLHLSIGKHNTNPEAIKFLQWVIYHGQDNLNEFGFLKPEAKRFEKEKEKFEQLALNKSKK